MSGLEIAAYTVPAFVAGYLLCLLTTRRIDRRERREHGQHERREHGQHERHDESEGL